MSNLSNPLSKTPKSKNSQRICGTSTQYAGYSFSFTAIPQHSIFQFNKFSVKDLQHLSTKNRSNLLTSDASITRKVVW